MFSPGLSLEFSCTELVIQCTICRHIVGQLMQKIRSSDKDLPVRLQFQFLRQFLGQFLEQFLGQFFLTICLTIFLTILGQFLGRLLGQFV